jgi:uncharacterized protein YbaP (TraB family)
MSRSHFARSCASLVSVTLLLSGHLMGCAGTSESLSEQQLAQLEDRAPVFLWAVSKEGKPGRAHLYGSVHLKPPSDRGVDRAVARLFDAATDLVFEADPSPENAAAIQKTVRALSTYPEGETLEAHLGPALYGQVKEVVMPLMGIPEAAIQGLKPWLLSIMIEGYMAAKLGFEQESGTEQWALRRAGGAKAIHELEGAEVQLELFSALPEKAQIDQLREMLDTIEEAPGKLQAVLDLYEAGDEAGLTRHLFQDSNKNPSSELLFERFFYERNEQMAAKIDTLLDQDKTYFVVVGTGHLVGDKSIGEFLKTTHGYTLEKVAAEGRPSGEEAAVQREADKRLSTPEQAAELRADIQTRLDTQAYAEAVTMATMGAHQLRSRDEVIEGFLDADYLSILRMGCEPAEWIGNWPQAGRCWTRVLDACGRMPESTKEQEAFAVLGIALAAAQLGQDQQSDEVLTRAMPFFEAKPTLTPMASARLYSVMAQLSQGEDPKQAYALAGMALESLNTVDPTTSKPPYPPDHPAWRPVLMARTVTAYWLGRGADVKAQADHLVENLSEGEPLNPVLRDIFILQRSGFRAEAGDKTGALADVTLGMAGLREALPKTSATFIQYLQAAAKTYIRVGDKRRAAAALKEIEELITKAGVQLGGMAPILIADLKLIEGRYLILKRKKKKAIAAMRTALSYAQEHLEERPVAIGMLQCQLAQSLSELKMGKREIPDLRAKGMENLKTAFNEDHPAHEACQKGTLPW